MADFTSLTLVLACLIFGTVSGQQGSRDDQMTSLLGAIQELREHVETAFQDITERMNAEASRRQALAEQLDMCVTSGEGLGRLPSTRQSPPSTTTSLPATTTSLPVGSSTGPIRCGDGYETFENHCYLFDTVRRNWTDAREVCQGAGAYLVSVNTQREQDFLVSHLPNDNIHYWLGMMWMPEDRLIWLDGTDVDYTSWGPHEPNCMNGGCKAFLSFSYNHSWEDAMRSYKYYFICETDMLPYQPTDVCPPGYHAFDHHCYIFEIDEVSWYRADWVCGGQGAYLLSVNSQTEWDFIIDKVHRYYDTTEDNGFWLGMEYSQSERKLLWSDGTDVNYTRWARGRPNCMSNACQAYFFDYTRETWHLARDVFQRKRAYICEMSQTP